MIIGCNSYNVVLTVKINGIDDILDIFTALCLQGFVVNCDNPFMWSAFGHGGKWSI